MESPHSSGEAHHDTEEWSPVPPLVTEMARFIPSTVFARFRDADFHDVVCIVGEASFELHRVVMCAFSPLFERLVRAAETPEISIDDLPGGAEAFSLAADFCYGLPVSLTLQNVVGVLLASNHLEMLGDGNLVSVAEIFLDDHVACDPEAAWTVLLSCLPVAKAAEDAGIIGRLLHVHGGGPLALREELSVLPLSWFVRAVAAAEHEGNASPAAVTSTVLRFIRNKMPTLNAEGSLTADELDLIVGERDLVLAANDAVMLLRLASDLGAKCVSHLAELAAGQIQGLRFADKASELTPDDLERIIAFCVEPEEQREAALLVDRALVDRAEANTLESGTFLRLLALTPPEARPCTDALWGPLLSLLTAESATLDKQGRMLLCAAIDLSRLSPQLLAAAIEHPSIPSRCVAAASVRLRQQAQGLTQALETEQKDTDALMQQLEATQLQLARERASREALKAEVEALRGGGGGGGTRVQTGSNVPLPRPKMVSPNAESALRRVAPTGPRPASAGARS